MARWGEIVASTIRGINRIIFLRRTASRNNDAIFRMAGGRTAHRLGRLPISDVLDAGAVADVASN